MYRVSKRPDKGSGFFVVLEAKSVDILHAMKHIVLLGDSIFDNAVYVNGGPDVIKQLRSILPQDWQASLLAVDGSVATDVITQIPLIPASATHLTVSAGGNDALSRADILECPVGSVGAAVDQLAALRAEFQQNYRRMLNALLALKLPLALCTVYACWFLLKMSRPFTASSSAGQWPARPTSPARPRTRANRIGFDWHFIRVRCLRVILSR